MEHSSATKTSVTVTHNRQEMIFELPQICKYQGTYYLITEAVTKSPRDTELIAFQAEYMTGDTCGLDKDNPKQQDKLYKEPFRLPPADIVPLLDKIPLPIEEQSPRRACGHHTF